MLIDSGIASEGRVFSVTCLDDEDEKENPDPIEIPQMHEFWLKKAVKLSLVSELRIELESFKGLLTRPSVNNSPEDILCLLICALVDRSPKFKNRRISIESRTAWYFDDEYGEEPEDSLSKFDMVKFLFRMILYKQDLTFKFISLESVKESANFLKLLMTKCTSLVL